MYRGYKDARIQITVPQKFCYEQHMSGKTFIEIRIPDKNQIQEIDQNGTTYVNWKSFMVLPEQVYYKDAYYNVIDGICRNTKIVICPHYYTADGTYKADRQYQETVDPYEILRRFALYDL